MSDLYYYDTRKSLNALECLNTGILSDSAVEVISKVIQECDDLCEEYKDKLDTIERLVGILEEHDLEYEL